MDMRRVQVWVCLYPTHTHTQIRFKHTRPISVFAPIVLSISTINGAVWGQFFGFESSSGTPIPETKELLDQEKGENIKCYQNIK